FRDRVGVDVRVAAGLNQLARRQERVGIVDGARDVLGGELTRLRAQRIDDDVDLALAAAVERGARDTADSLEDRLDVVEGVVVERRVAHIAAGDYDLHDRRVRWIVLQY